MIDALINSGRQYKFKNLIIKQFNKTKANNKGNGFNIDKNL